MSNETNRINGYVAKIKTLAKSMTPNTALKHFTDTAASSQLLITGLIKFHDSETLEQFLIFT